MIGNRRTLVLLLVAVGTLVSVVGGATLARAVVGTAWYVAPTGADSNSCSVATEPCATPQGAVGKAAAGDTIRIAVGTYTSTDFQVVFLDQDLTLEGGWNDTFTARTGLSTIDGGGARKGVVIGGGVDARIERFRVQNGVPLLSPVPGGGIANSGNLELDQSVVRANTLGGIWNGGTLLVTNSTISENTNNQSSNGGGLTNSWMGNPTSTVVNSTISGNSSSEGGGIYIGMPITGSATVSLYNVTITGNTAWGGGGGGIVASGPSTPPVTLNLRNSIVANNAAYYGGDIQHYNAASIVSQGYNIVGSFLGPGFVPPGPGDQWFVDPVLESLAMNGGATATHALGPWSPAIGKGNPTGCRDGNGQVLTTDQRGAARPVGRFCDIGAYESPTEKVRTPPRPCPFCQRGG